MIPISFLFSLSSPISKYTYYADYVGRGLPLVCIDSRQPPKISKLQKEASVQSDPIVDFEEDKIRQLRERIFEEAKSHLFSIEEELNPSHSWNYYDVGILSFLKTKIVEFSKKCYELDPRSRFTNTGHSSQKFLGSKAEKLQWLFMVLYICTCYITSSLHLTVLQQLERFFFFFF